MHGRSYAHPIRSIVRKSAAELFRLSAEDLRKRFSRKQTAHDAVAAAAVFFKKPFLLFRIGVNFPGTAENTALRIVQVSDDVFQRITEKHADLVRETAALQAQPQERQSLFKTGRIAVPPQKRRVFFSGKLLAQFIFPKNEINDFYSLRPKKTQGAYTKERSCRRLSASRFIVLIKRPPRESRGGCEV